MDYSIIFRVNLIVICMPVVIILQMIVVLPIIHNRSNGSRNTTISHVGKDKKIEGD
jgi:hypothetical protein